MSKKLENFMLDETTSEFSAWLINLCNLLKVAVLRGGVWVYFANQTPDDLITIECDDKTRLIQSPRFWAENGYKASEKKIPMVSLDQAILECYVLEFESGDFEDFDRGDEFIEVCEKIQGSDLGKGLSDYRDILAAMYQ